MTRSAPSSPLAWSCTACCRLVLNDPIATSAAMPRMIDAEKRRSRRREARESRQAILRMKDIWILVPGSWLLVIGFGPGIQELGTWNRERLIAHHRAALEAHDAL